MRGMLLRLTLFLTIPSPTQQLPPTRSLYLVQLQEGVPGKEGQGPGLPAPWELRAGWQWTWVGHCEKTAGALEGLSQEGHVGRRSRKETYLQVACMDEVTAAPPAALAPDLGKLEKAGEAVSYAKQPRPKQQTTMPAQPRGPRLTPVLPRGPPQPTLLLLLLPPLSFLP